VISGQPRHVEKLLKSAFRHVWKSEVAGNGAINCVYVLALHLTMTRTV
jgi:hypothetical protein